MNFPLRHSKAAKPALLGTLVLALACLALPSAADAKPRKIYWGAHLGDQLTGTPAPADMGAVTKFQRVAGKGLSLIGHAAPFADCSNSPCTFHGFPTSLMEDIRRYGAIPFFTWASHAVPPGGLNQPAFQLGDVLRGDYDAYIRGFAQGAKSWGHPFFMRFNPEMNGNWFVWSERRNGNKRGESVAVWRHVVRIFRQVGANNVTWVWCPNVNINDDSALQHNLRALYPGKRYVDWTCLDGFNWGLRGGSPGWLSFKEIFARTYRRIVKFAPTKPMVLGEVATSDAGGSKPAWIRNMLATIPRKYRKIRGFLWNDVHDRDTNWPIETSRRATRAFRRGINRGVYQRNKFSNLPNRPIRPPH